MLEAAEGKLETSRELTSNTLGDDEDHGKSLDSKPRRASHTGEKFLMTDLQMVDNLILFLMAGFDR